MGTVAQRNFKLSKLQIYRFNVAKKYNGNAATELSVQDQTLLMQSNFTYQDFGVAGLLFNFKDSHFMYNFHCTSVKIT